MSKPQIKVKSEKHTSDPITYGADAYFMGILVASAFGEEGETREQVRSEAIRRAKEVGCDNCGAKIEYLESTCNCGNFVPS